MIAPGFWPLSVNSSPHDGPQRHMTRHELYLALMGGDASAADKLIVETVKLVELCAKHFRNVHASQRLDVDELTGCGCLAVIQLVRCGFPNRRALAASDLESYLQRVIYRAMQHNVDEQDLIQTPARVRRRRRLAKQPEKVRIAIVPNETLDELPARAGESLTEESGSPRPLPADALDKQILEGCAAGMSIAALAAKLDITERTVLRRRRRMAKVAA